MKRSTKGRMSRKIRNSRVKSLRLQFQRNLPECPQVVTDVCEHIENHGAKLEGILRISGAHKEVAILKERYAAGKRNDLSEYNIHSAGSLLSQYLSELPNPIFTFEMYDLWMASMALTPRPLLLECVRHAISLLPPGNRVTLDRLLRMFRVVAAERDSNKMSAENIAIAFTPAMIRPEVETIETLVAHGETSQNLLALMIKQYSDLFETPPEMELPDHTPELYVEIFEEAKEFLALTTSNQIDFSQPEEDVIAAAVQQEEVEVIPEEEKPIALIQALWKGRQTRKMFRKLNVKYQLQYNTGVWELMKRESNFIWAVKKDVRDFESKIDTINCKLSKLVEREEKTKVEEWQSKLAETEVKTIMANLKAILETHNMVLEEITSSWSTEWPMVGRIGAVLLSKVPLFIVYNAYVDMYIRLQRQLSAVDANPALKTWMTQALEKTADRKQRGPSRTLGDLVLLPFKHLSGWIQPLQKLVLAAITFNEDPVDRKDLVKAYAIMSRMAVFVDTLVLWTESEAVSSIEERFSSTPRFWGENRPGRRLVLQTTGAIASETRIIMLFSDHLLVCKRSSKKRLKYCYHLDLTECASVESMSKAAFKIDHKDRVYLVVLKTVEEKMKWVQTMQSTMAAALYFGVSLPRVMDIQKRCFPDIKSSIPRVLERLVSFLQQRRDCTEADLCLHGDSYAVGSLRTKVETLGVDNADLGEFTNNDIVGTIKQWLVRLPEPLMEQEQLPVSMLFKDKDHTVINAGNFGAYLRSLPETSVAVIRYVVEFLATSRGCPTLLGYTWAQCIIRPVAQNVDTTLKVLLASQVLTVMILEKDTIFGAMEQVPEVDVPDHSFSKMKRRSQTHIGMITRSNSEMTLNTRKIKKLKDKDKDKDKESPRRDDKDHLKIGGSVDSVDSVVSPRSSGRRSMMDMLSPRWRKKKDVPANLSHSSPVVSVSSDTADEADPPKPDRPVPTTIFQPTTAPPSRIVPGVSSARPMSGGGGGGGTARRAASAPRSGRASTQAVAVQQANPDYDIDEEF